MLDRIVGVDSLWSVDVEGTDPTADRNFLQMGRVGGVVAPNHHHQIHGFVNELEHGVLPLLGGIADGVES